MRIRFGAALFAFLLGSLPASANPTLIGDLVEGSISTFLLPGITTQFTSPAIVGPGIEFTGGIQFSFNHEPWIVSVDIGADSWTIGWIDGENGDGNVSGPRPLLEVHLSGLDFVPARLIDYSCISPGFSCELGAVPRISAISQTDHSIDVFFDTLLSGETYTFGVPEPATLALVALGLILMRVGARRHEGC